MNERGKAMAAMYAEGYTMGEIANEYGISRQRVHQIIQGSYERGHWGRRKKDARRERLLAAHARIMAGESTLHEEAEREGRTSDGLRSSFYELGLRLTPPSPEHGTGYRYRCGCRCEECTRAMREQRVYWRESRKSREPPEHGTESAYKNWGCRCDLCKAAGSESNRRWRLSHQRRQLLQVPEN